MDALSILKLKQETKKRISEWLHYVRGRAVGEKRRHVYWNVPANVWCDRRVDAMKSITVPMIETEDMMVLEIPVRELASMSETQEWYRQNISGLSLDLFDKIIRDKHNEEYLRGQHPGLQDCWEKYQIMLVLCSDKSFK